MIPGFEDGLVGASAGDERTLELTFPEDYHSEELKGAAVEFKVSVKEVKTLEPAELNAELFAAYGVEGDDVDDFRAEVRKNMERTQGCCRRSRQAAGNGCHYRSAPSA